MSDKGDRQDNTESALTGITAFRSLGDKIGTAGQPTAEQFPAIRDAGFEAVINLALPTSTNAIGNEGSIVTALGMAYVHIPVDFQAPSERDFQAFARIMNVFEGRSVFVHCAMNMRVSAFMFLYRVTQKGVPATVAEKDMHAIWEPDEIWSRFISKIIA